jgi:hypothetical protein
MEALTTATFLVALGLWMGGVVFFSFFTAPVIFGRLPRDQAADLISIIFPRYYALGYSCGALMIAAALYPLSLRPGWVGTWLILILAVAATVVSFYSGQIVMPRVRRLRASAEGSLGTADHGSNLKAYNDAHQLSVGLNTFVLAVLLAEAVLFAYRVRFDFVH